MPTLCISCSLHRQIPAARPLNCTLLNKLNSVCKPLRYIWVFVACILLKKAGDRFGQEYKFTKGKVLGAWCLFVTLACQDT